MLNKTSIREKKKFTLAAENGLQEEKAEAGKQVRKLQQYSKKERIILYLSGDNGQKWTRFKIPFRGRKLGTGSYA